MQDLRECARRGLMEVVETWKFLAESLIEFLPSVVLSHMMQHNFKSGIRV